MSSTVAVETGAYRALFEERQNAGRTDPPWLPVHRRAALERFEELGFPSQKVEEWRFTSTAPLARGGFVHATGDGPGAVTPETLARLAFGGAFRGHQLVVMNGRFAPELSSLEDEEGVAVLSLAEALRRYPDRIEPHLAQVTPDERNPFAALNTALFEDGACVIVEPGRLVETPIHLVFLSAPPAGERALSHPRALVLVGRGSQATVVEAYGGPEGTAYWTNAVSELVLEDGAAVDHYKLQREGESGYHVATLSVTQGRDSRFTDHSICLGGALARNDINTRLGGPGGECVLNGLFMARGEQHMDTHSRVDHVAPHCASRELYRGILDGTSRGVFHGRIVVRPGAQKTDAAQTNKNLLLTRQALVHSTPQLEIFADDVKCKHGATTGQIDPAALFYLRSRGIDERAARSLLTYAFASDLAGRLRVPELREGLEAFLHERLPEAPQEAMA